MSAWPDRRGEDRRALPDRRQGDDRRSAPDESSTAPTPDRRSGEERRKSERRAGVERRLAHQSGIDQVRAALEVLTTLAERGGFDDERRRLVDAAMVRLRFALDRLNNGA